ncbi:Zinc knuckle CX2CX4HX4C [Arabidopsis thaliana x Arabidopsis arenosa]|uniref:Zinc knuckle CX2CX4HX4C n=1 Tax=Arabidopsis thaliana x Arabidopsis arenosa TaxID=1240361 RepID=A0A8T1YZP5_9BRAS|nr:Zinc knuckle CX2CX4HX4C [Arabidopsis thaliana x Arabidopsis arenosa]
MSSSIDKALMAMTLEEDEVPFKMPDLPEFCSSEKNELSLVGRVLNPDGQKMANLIMNLPRKWQIYDRVRGVALSQERFQFIFTYEHDLEMVLKKGVQTFNEWTLAIERWTEFPPLDYLQFILVWVQIRNIPINHYTTKAITALGEIIGQVKEVAFDPLQPQSQDFVRVLVRFDVTKPLRRSKVVSFKHIGDVTIFYDFERIQKRCFFCQRLTHDQSSCPFLLKANQEKKEALRHKGKAPVKVKEKILKESDPLFGVLEEDQVGLDPNSGRPRIAKEVLDGMRQYLLVANGPERIVREERIKISMADLRNDPMAEKTMLRLEPMPIVSRDINKGKGVVFSYENMPDRGVSSCHRAEVGERVSFAVREGLAMSLHAGSSHTQSEGDRGSVLACGAPAQGNPTVFRFGVSDAEPSSGPPLRSGKPRKRPYKTRRRKATQSSLAKAEQSVVPKKINSKRKAADEAQSLGRSQDLAIPRLKELRKKHFPEILFLMETMQCRDKLLDLQVLLGYDRLFTVEPVGKCGGLALLWKNSVQMDILHEDKNLIDVQVQFGSFNFFLSCVYGDPDNSLRSVVWERLKRIGIGRRDRWCMVGDFNSILHNGEKVGGPRRSDSCFKPFSEMLEICEMTELTSCGNHFTWAGRRGIHWVQCRLDRAFGNKDWLVQFPASNQAFLEVRGSDHRPVMICLVKSQDSYKGQFRFDRRFLHKAEVKVAVARAWKPGIVSGGFLVSSRLRACRKALSSWKKKNKMNSLQKINQCEDALEKVQSERWPNLQQVHVLKRELSKAYKNEEIYWSQKSRQRWLRSGNRNSKYFHGSVKGNRARKRIEKLKDARGVFQNSEAAKGEVAAEYFNKLFKSSNPHSFQNWFSGFRPRVSADMNESLMAVVSAEEIREAVFSIKASSAPGPDGMTALFFQQFWSIVGKQMIKEIQSFFESVFFPAEWNYTYLCLLPKIQLPLDMSDLRPISLCSVLYKSISKILVNRLQPILPQIVSVNQSAFVSERLITDNIIVAHEVVHSLRTHSDLSANFMAVKTDMSKAYDRVEWSYLRSLLVAMGFHLKWIDWIMCCVSTVTFSVLINDQPFGLINPERGLRQGDPLSPFLFVLCTEGLTHLLDNGQREGRIQGIKFNEEGPEVHHLLFADDSLFMCRASLEQSMFLKETLKRYGEATGQFLNLSKSSITFGSKVDPLLKLSIQNRMGIFNEGGAGGKEVLLKSVALAMPVFVMSCFKMPKTTCDNLSSALADFWWSNTEHGSKIHWQSWEKLCLPKDLGGLGFRGIQTFNQALLAKQAWRLLQFPDSLFARFLKSRYYPQTDFLNAGMGTRPSYAWKSILHGRDLLSKGLVKNIGNGKSFRVWIDDWIEDDGWRAPYRRNYFFNPDLRISELINWDKRIWDPQKLEFHFPPLDILRINKIKPVTELEDFYSWKHNKSGDFSVKSAYWLASQSSNLQTRILAEQLPSTNDLKAQVWALQTDPKIHVFLWKVLCGALPVAAALLGKGMKIDSRCQLCGDEDESVNHVLFTCSMARQIWALTGIPSPSWGFHNGSVFNNIHYLLMNTTNTLWPQELRLSFPWTLWRIWKNRNLASFEGKCFSPLESAQKVKEDWTEWVEAQKGDEEIGLVNGPETHDLSPLVHGIGNRRSGWSPPPLNWFKCNIGLMWAIESMRSHRVENVIFGLQVESLVKAINRPIAWPSFRYQSMEAGLVLKFFRRWKIILENSSSNRCAFLIAKSVTNDCRLQSYVAVGHPFWLDGVFAEERALASD